MNPNERIVMVRTSQSASDFWSRPRDEEKEVSPSLRAVPRPSFDVGPPSSLSPLMLPFETPYNRQIAPWSTQRSDSPSLSGRTPNRVVLAPLTASRIVERNVYRDALYEMDARIPGLIDDNRRLHDENKRLQRHVKATLKITKALTDIIIEGQSSSR